MADEKELKDIEGGKMCKKMQREKTRLTNLAAVEFQKQQDRIERKANPNYEPKVLVTGIDKERKHHESARDEYRRAKLKRREQAWKGMILVMEGKVSKIDEFCPEVASQSGKNLPLIAGGFRNNKGDEGTR